MTAEVRIKINRADVKASVQEITKVFSESLKRWWDEEPRRDKGDKLFYCPVCSRTASTTYYSLKRYGKPKCLTCDKTEMEEYDGQHFRKLRQRLVDEALPKVPQIVEALLEVVSIHGILDGAEAVVEYYLLSIRPDYTPNEFRYDPFTKRLEAFFYYYDSSQHLDALKTLIKKAWKLGLGILVHIYPGHREMPLPYHHLPIGYDIVNGYKIKMTAEELQEFARGYGGFY
jgi:transposase-like protein